jgi:hypothetical protein
VGVSSRSVFEVVSLDIKQEKCKEKREERSLSNSSNIGTFVLSMNRESEIPEKP